MLSQTKHKWPVALLAMAGVLALSGAHADDRRDPRLGRDNQRSDPRQESRESHNDRRPDNRRPMPQRDSRGYVLDHRYSHNRYYPPRGRVVTVAPRGAYIVRHGGVPYYYNSGIWYRPYGPRFVVVTPPFGLWVGALPPYYSTLWWGGVPYYYADDVYYRRERDGYVVSEPPPNADESQAPVESSSEDLYIYPKNGQSEEEQSKDRYECHSWAAGQSGFDPTQPLGGVDESQAAAKRADYHRAMTACLEGRGYSVK